MASIINATTSTGLVSSADNSGSLQLATNNGTTAVTIDTSQNVGIGTSSPFGTAANRIVLSINGTTDANFTMGSGGSQRSYLVVSSSSVDLSTVGAIPLTFGTNASERMRITSAGSLCVGTTGNQSAKFSLDCTTGDSFGAFFKHNTSGGATLGVNAQNPTSTHVQWYNSGTPTGSITWNGASAVAYNTSSDYRLKKDIAPMIGALDKVALLKPVTYKWKLDDSDGQGFIAHELAEVCPDAVSGIKDAVETYTDEDGNEQTRIKPQGIDTSFLVATLTAAIQELKAELDATKAEVAALKGVA